MKRRLSAVLLPLILIACQAPFAFAQDTTHATTRMAKPQAPRNARVDSTMAWLAGHWSNGEGADRVEELWLEPRGGAMLGMHRDLRSGKFVFFEFSQTRLALENTFILGLSAATVGTLLVTVVCGTAHVLSSVALGMVGLAIGAGLGWVQRAEGMRGDWMLAGVTAVVFGLVTLVTMSILVLAAHAGFERFSLGPLERWSHAAAGTVIAASGLAILFLGL